MAAIDEIVYHTLMSVWVYCGDDTSALEAALLSLKKNYDRSLPIDQPFTLPSIEAAVANESLFQENKLLLFRDALGSGTFRGKPTATFAPVLSVLQANEQAVDMVFIEKDPKKAKTFQGLFKKATVVPFALPNYMYSFLDAVYPGNSASALQLFAQASDASAAELVFYLLKRRVRDLITVAQKQPMKELQAWQAGKLRAQAAHWTIDLLYSFYGALYAIEKGIKTSTLPYSLHEALEVALVFYLTENKKNV